MSENSKKCLSHFPRVLVDDIKGLVLFDHWSKTEGYSVYKMLAKVAQAINWIIKIHG